MKNLIKFVFVVLIFSAVLASLYFAWDYRQHYGDWNTKRDITDIRETYNVGKLDKSALKRIEGIELPDLSPYTKEAILAKQPAVDPGYLLIENIEVGYRKMRSRRTFFGDKQGRLDALSIVVSGGVYDLDTVVKQVDDPTIIEKKDDNTYALYVPLNIRAEGALLIQEGETLLLSINKGAMLSTFGDLFIVGASVKAWDTEKDKPAYYTKREEFRPHITGWCGANVHIVDSYIAHLGYQASKSYGLTYTSCVDTLYREDYAHLPGATGWILNNVFDDVYFGFYSYEADNVVIVGNEYKNNIVYGVDPHDRSRHLIIARNHAYGSKEKHGIIVSREVAYSYIFDNLSEGNNGSGIMIDRNSHDNVIANNVARNNKADGLVFFESPNNISFGNKLVHNGNSGMRIRNSWNIVSQNDVINFNENAAVKLYSLYLTAARGATFRDLDLDPYVQKAGVTFFSPEVVGNVKNNFNLEDFDYFQLVEPVLFKSPEFIFGGELKGSDYLFEEELLKQDGAIAIISKEEPSQTLTTTSDAPPILIDPYPEAEMQ
jgi:poly(beta-D-mannuronate) C5 epimerase